MIPGRIGDIDKEALKALIENEVRENKSIEYKQEIPGKADSDVVPFLATVSSLANTAGGDLLLGVKANKGVPVELSGIQIGDVDQEKLRLEHMLLNGVEPRLPGVDIQEIEVAKDTYVLVIRVAGSWSAPHRVNKISKFYARHSTGRYELDVGELRDAFTFSEGVVNRIGNFRVERIGRILSDRSPVSLQQGARMVLHVVPRAAFSTANAIDIAALESQDNRISPMGQIAMNYRVNLDGFVTFYTASGCSSADAYTQVFRNGAVESASVLDVDQLGAAYIPSVAYERNIIGVLRSYLEIAGKFELHPPYFAFLSLVAVRGARLVVQNAWGDPRVLTTNDETLMLPEIAIEERCVQPEKALRPLFDMVWNAFGYSRSSNYDEHGNWSP